MGQLQFTLMSSIYDWFSWRYEWDRLDSLLDFGVDTRILDLGGGTGKIGRYFLDHGVSSQWFVVDYNQSMLNAGWEDRKDIHWIRGNGTTLPLPDGSMDRILMSDSFHHMQESNQVLRESHRVLNEDGYLCVEEFDPTTWLGKTISLGEWTLAMGSHFYSPETL
ncbi:MAG: class I SAM-dependent methyltransferase, partial [bacterium]